MHFQLQLWSTLFGGKVSRIKLVFRIDKEAGRHLLETPLSTDQQVVDLDDIFEISATVVDSARLKWWLRGFGSSLSVEVPRGLMS